MVSQSRTKPITVLRALAFVLLLASIIAYGGMQMGLLEALGLKTVNGLEMVVSITQLGAEELEGKYHARELMETALLGANGDAEALAKTKSEIENLYARLDILLQEINPHEKTSATTNAKSIDREELARLTALQKEQDGIYEMIYDLKNPSEDRKDEISREIAASERTPDTDEVQAAIKFISARLKPEYGRNIRIKDVGHKGILVQIPGIDLVEATGMKRLIEGKGDLQFRLLKDMTEEDQKKANRGIQLTEYDLMFGEIGNERLYVDKTRTSKNTHLRFCSLDAHR